MNPTCSSFQEKGLVAASNALEKHDIVWWKVFVASRTLCVFHSSKTILSVRLVHASVVESFWFSFSIFRSSPSYWLWLGWSGSFWMMGFLFNSKKTGLFHTFSFFFEATKRFSYSIRFCMQMRGSWVSSSSSSSSLRWQETGFNCFSIQYKHINVLSFNTHTNTHRKEHKHQYLDWFLVNISTDFF